MVMRFVQSTFTERVGENLQVRPQFPCFLLVHLSVRPLSEFRPLVIFFVHCEIGRRALVIVRVHTRNLCRPVVMLYVHFR